MEAPDGQGVGSPWTARAISARACRPDPPVPGAGASSRRRRTCCGPTRDASEEARRTSLPARPPPKAASVAVRAPSPAFG